MSPPVAPAPLVEPAAPPAFPPEAELDILKSPPPLDLAPPLESSPEADVDAAAAVAGADVEVTVPPAEAGALRLLLFPVAVVEEATGAPSSFSGRRLADSTGREENKDKELDVVCDFLKLKHRTAYPRYCACKPFSNLL